LNLWEREVVFWFAHKQVFVNEMPIEKGDPFSSCDSSLRQILLSDWHLQAKIAYL